MNAELSFQIRTVSSDIGKFSQQSNTQTKH